MPSSLISTCRFNPTLGGTTDWTYSSAVVGYSSPALAGAINAAVYSYRAESADLSQWEEGVGAYNSGTGVFARTTVLYNSSGTGTGPGQSGAGTKISFTTAPQVAIVALAEDLFLFNAAMSLTSAQKIQVHQNLATPLKGYLFGLTLSTAGSSASFGIAAGQAVDATGVLNMVLGSAYTKTTAAWALGSAVGSLDTGAITNSTWYHVYEIQRPDTGVVDIAISLSASAPTTGVNIPAAYTLFRRIGSMKTNGSAQWTAFSQLGDEFLWTSPVQDMSAVASSTTATLTTITVPTGVQVGARLLGYGNGGTGTGTVINSPDETSVAGGSLLVGYSFIWASGSQTGAAIPPVRTNTSAQVRVTSTATGAVIYLVTEGWTDRRGRDT